MVCYVNQMYVCRILTRRIEIWLDPLPAGPTISGEGWIKNAENWDIWCEVGKPYLWTATD